MLGSFQDRSRAGKGGVGILQFHRGVDRAALLAGIAVLVLGTAVRAFTLDVAVREEHSLYGVVELLPRLRIDEPRRLQLAIDVLRQLDVLGGVRRMPVVEI